MARRPQLAANAEDPMKRSHLAPAVISFVLPVLASSCALDEAPPPVSSGGKAGSTSTSSGGASGSAGTPAVTGGSGGAAAGSGGAAAGTGGSGGGSAGTGGS